MTGVNINIVATIFYYRYVDDCTTAVAKRMLKKVIEIFNSVCHSIRFTHEEETDQKLPFLDIEIIRKDDGTLLTNWYHKPTWSGRYLNYNSHLPATYKRNTISLFTRKILELSDPPFHRSNFDLLRSTLQKNGSL